MTGTKKIESNESVIFVEPTKKPSLKIMIEKILKRNQLKIKVVEQVGETMKLSFREVTLSPPISA